MTANLNLGVGAKTGRKLAGTLRLFAALLLLASPAFPERNNWRYWNSSDGLAESFVRSVTAGADGRILVRHGEIGSMSLLDGYGVRSLPEVRTGPIVDWGIGARAYLQENGEIWAVDDGQLRRYRSGKWSQEAPKDAAHPMLAAVPAGDDRILVLFADRLAAYTPSRRTWNVLRRSPETCLGRFRVMAPGFFSDFWIAGESGVAHLEFSAAGAVVWAQSDIRKLGLENADYPMPAAGREVLFSARLAGRSRWAVVRWSEARLQVVFAGNQDNLRGWRGPDGELWVLDGTSLLQMPDGLEPKHHSGTVRDVLPMPDGSFWLGTTEGLERYTPAFWRTPAAVAGLDAPVHSAVEDALGRIWFSATEYLLELDGAVWRRHPLPLGLRTQAVYTRGLLALADGRLWVKAGAPGAAERVLVFDPKTGQFDTLRSPPGRALSLVVPRRDGTFWVHTKPGPDIELYDGKTFRPAFDLPAAWNGDVRCLLEAADGTLWIGGPGGAIVGKGGNFRELRAGGFADGSAFDIVELGPNQVLVGGRDKLLYFDGSKWSLWKSGLDRCRMITRTRDGTLWVASGSGLHRLQDGNWLSNGESEGLLATTVYVVFQDSRGRVWAGTDRGLNLYHPDADRESPSAGFASAGNLLEAGPGGNIPVFFAGADKWKNTPADRLLFSYRLDSGPWTAFSESDSATFEHLKTGSHSVRVRGMDRNGNINEARSPFAFQVALPWYRQSGFFGILAAAGLLVFALAGLAISNYRERGRFIVELNAARMAAESASRQKGQFLANMSHEIRTPMNGIIGMTELALELAANEEQRGYLNTVRRVSDSLLALLNDILDFSKVEAGKMTLAAVDFDLAESVRDVLRTLEAPAREKGLDLAMRVDPGVPPFLFGDDHRLAQMLVNLVGNAIKFSSNGEVRVEIRLRSKSENGADLEFVVCDEGIGIPPEKQQTIFAAFEQADGSTTRKYGGTGLGLAICTKLAELMHGRLWVESPWRSRETGQTVRGSAFHFTVILPLGKAPVREPEQAAPVSPGKLRVLLAEDNPVNQKMAVHLLERKGHTVSVANNGREAVDMATRELPDIVLMDIQMPEMDGFEATAAIRKWEQGRGSHLPIVALTAHAMDGDKARCLAHGFDLYLSKPFRAKELDAVLVQGAGRAGAPAEPVRRT